MKITAMLRVVMLCALFTSAFVAEPVSAICKNVPADPGMIKDAHDNQSSCYNDGEKDGKYFSIGHRTFCNETYVSGKKEGRVKCNRFTGSSFTVILRDGKEGKSRNRSQPFPIYGYCHAKVTVQPDLIAPGVLRVVAFSQISELDPHDETTLLLKTKNALKSKYRKILDGKPTGRCEFWLDEKRILQQDLNEAVTRNDRADTEVVFVELQ